MDVSGRTTHAYMDIGGTLTPQEYFLVFFHQQYSQRMEVSGRVESGTETESNAGAVAEETKSSSYRAIVEM